MAVHIQVNSPDLKLDENCVVHSMPCKINHDGQANVSGFFSPYIENKELDDSSDGGNFFILSIFFYGSGNTFYYI